MGKGSAKFSCKVVKIHPVLVVVSTEHLRCTMRSLLRLHSRPLLQDGEFLRAGMGSCFLLCNGHERSGGTSFETVNLQPSAVGASLELSRSAERGKSLPSCNFLVQNERKAFECEYQECSARDQAGHSEQSIRHWFPGPRTSILPLISSNFRLNWARRLA